MSSSFPLQLATWCMKGKAPQRHCLECFNFTLKYPFVDFHPFESFLKFHIFSFLIFEGMVWGFGHGVVRWVYKEVPLSVNVSVSVSGFIFKQKVVLS